MILLLIAVLVVYLIWRERRRRIPAVITPPPAAAPRTWGFRPGHSQRDRLSAWMRAEWLDAQGEQAAETQALVGWLRGLSDAEYLAFVQRVLDVARAAGISVETALRPSANPAVHTAAAGALRSSVLSVWRASTASAVPAA
jgi:hypothetical protein